MRLILTFLLICAYTFTYSQARIKVKQPGVTINDNGNETADPSAVLDIDSKTKGILFPRHTLVERNSIANPAPAGASSMSLS